MRSRGYSSPNQRNINVNKEECNTENLYAKINIEAMNSAMNNLKANTYKLWSYFAQNQNKHSLWLSPVDVQVKTGMSESTYHRAFDELVDKLYLIKDAKDQRYYNFYEVPHDIEH